MPSSWDHHMGCCPCDHHTSSWDYHMPSSWDYHMSSWDYHSGVPLPSSWYYMSSSSWDYHMPSSWDYHMPSSAWDSGVPHRSQSPPPCIAGEYYKRFPDGHASPEELAKDC